MDDKDLKKILPKEEYNQYIKDSEESRKRVEKSSEELREEVGQFTLMRLFFIFLVGFLAWLFNVK